MSILDIDEALIDLLKKVEVVRSTPLLDVKGFPPADVGIVEGAVATEEDVKTLRRMRDSCRTLVALGDCACFGGITSYRNLFDKEDILSRVYIETESTIEGKIPQSRQLPPLLEKVKPVNNIVTTDCYIPGCPPSPDVILYTFKELLAGRMPILPSEMASFE